jgi:hypothetical protein
MDWRLQIARLVKGLALTCTPAYGNFSHPTTYFTGIEDAVSAWNFTVSVTQCLLIASLVLAILGTFWRGSMGGRWAWTQVVLSFGLGSLMFIA